MFGHIAYTFEALIRDSGFAGLTWGNIIMLLVSFVFIYLAIVKGVEPLLMLPIAFGMLLANIPAAGIISPPIQQMRLLDVPPDLDFLRANATYLLELGESFSIINGEVFAVYTRAGGLMYYFYQGLALVIFPPLIFLGVGAMIDFGPLIAFPSSFLMSVAAQIGIFIAFIGALVLGFTAPEAGAISIIGSADGPTTIFVTMFLAPPLLGSVAVAAYTYMSLLPIIQPPFMKLLTTDKERRVVMKQLRVVSKTEKIVFPVVTTLLVCLLVPPATPLVGMLMLGNLLRESGVAERLSKTAQNELINIVTILLATSVGATTNADTFLTAQTLMITALGLFAFIMSTIAGVTFGKIMCAVTGGKINPLIGSASVSAIPMAAGVCQQVGAKYDPNNFLLMHAMGPNVSGVVASAVVAGAMISVLTQYL